LVRFHCNGKQLRGVEGGEGRSKREGLNFRLQTAQALYDGIESKEVVRDVPELQDTSLSPVDRELR
jgi:hypothetical protein